MCDSPSDFRVIWKPVVIESWIFVLIVLYLPKIPQVSRTFHGVRKFQTVAMKYSKRNFYSVQRVRDKELSRPRPAYLYWILYYIFFQKSTKSEYRYFTSHPAKSRLSCHLGKVQLSRYQKKYLYQSKTILMWVLNFKLVHCKNLSRKLKLRNVWYRSVTNYLDTNKMIPKNRDSQFWTYFDP